MIEYIVPIDDLKAIVEGRDIKHKFHLYYDLIEPILSRIVGKRFGCCNKLKNCNRCIRRNGWDFIGHRLLTSLYEQRRERQ